MAISTAWMRETLNMFEGDKTKAKEPRRRPPLERATHIAIADLLGKLAKPDWYWTHIPSGEYRTEATGKLLRRMGLKPGIPDFMLIDHDGCHYYLELKRDKAPLSPSQIEFMDMCRQRDIPHVVARSFDQAAKALNAWGVLRDARFM